MKSFPMFKKLIMQQRLYLACLNKVEKTEGNSYKLLREGIWLKISRFFQ